jgi:hypothetical protein
MSSERRPLVGIQIDNEDAKNAADQIRRYGIEATCLHLPWGAVEKAPGEYDWSALDHWNTIRSIFGTPPRPAWFLFPLHMNERGDIPPDLRTVALDAPEMIERWDAWVAETAPRAGWDDTEALITIGNEVDLFVDAHPDERDAAVTFLNAATESVNRHAPGALTGNCSTWDSVQRPEGAELWTAINERSALAIFTWYDLQGVRVTRPPTSIDATLTAMTRFAAGKPLYLQEIAMPTAPACDGDDDLQAERVHELFDALATRSQEDVLAVIWLTTRDWPREFMREWVTNQFPSFDGDEQFLGFLTSMGFVREDGTAKPADHVWQQRAASYRSGVKA